MTKYINLIDNKYFESLEDCKTSSVELKDNKLTFIFSKEGLSYPFVSKGIYNLQITYELSENFLDEEFLPVVRKIDKSKSFKRKKIKYYTLKDFLNYINENNLCLNIYSDYYNQNKCLLIVELIKNGHWRSESEFDIELIADKIIYNW